MPSLIVIEHADRFGLAQLHQLRGRVGRGSARSVCLLLRGRALGETARARLALMRETNDGFRIAEEDLRLRGAGELLGTRQSGDVQFRLATPDMLVALLPAANGDARLLIDRDGGLKGERGQAGADRALPVRARRGGRAAARGLALAADQGGDEVVIAGEIDRDIELAADPSAKRPAHLGGDDADDGQGHADAVPALEAPLAPCHQPMRGDIDDEQGKFAGRRDRTP